MTPTSTPTTGAGPEERAEALIRTDETADEYTLEIFYDHDLEDGPLPDVIQTHDGEWRREGDLFRWWQHDDEDGGFYLPRVEAVAR